MIKLIMNLLDGGKRSIMCLGIDNFYEFEFEVFNVFIFVGDNFVFGINFGNCFGLSLDFVERFCEFIFECRSFLVFFFKNEI